MAYVPGYKHDIFVSYAHVDDQVSPGAERGWVSALVEFLKIRLSEKLGRKDSYRIWKDSELRGNTPLTPEILGCLRNSATLLVVFSPGYLASDWCLKECQSFLDSLKEATNSSARVFFVERDRMERSSRPEGLQDLRGYRFWIQPPEGHRVETLGSAVTGFKDPRYHSIVGDLCHDLVEELKKLRAAEKRAKQQNAEEPSIDENRPTVFLAEVTDDLDEIRLEVQRYLKQAKVRVFPEVLYPRNPPEFEKALNEDLSRSKLFVQLLSQVAGKKFPDLPQGYVHLQGQQAERLNVPILKWRNPRLDCQETRDQDHRAILEGPHVHAVGIEEFKQEVVRQAFLTPQSTIQSSEPFVFINAQQEDRSLADMVSGLLDRQRFGYALPLQKGKPGEIRGDLEGNLLDCDGLIIVYGKITASWVREQLRFSRKVFSLREKPLVALAVCEGPPPEKDPLDYKLPNMITINARNGVEEPQMSRFIDALRRGLS